MSGLWISLAGLLVLAFSFLVWPLLPFSRNKKGETSDQKQQNIDVFKERLAELESELNQGTLEPSTFEALKTELQKNLLQDVHESKHLKQIPVNSKHWLIVLVFILLLSTLSLGMYFKIGRSDDLATYFSLAKNQTNQDTAPDMNQAIAMLEEKLRNDPDNKEKQILLANSYAVIGQYSKAAHMYASMAAKVAPDSDVYAGLIGAQAQSLFQSTGEKMTPKIQSLIKKALTVDPFEPSSLMLEGINAYTQKQFKQAISHWEKAKQKAGRTQVSQFINPAILSAQEQLGIKSQPQLASKQPSKPDSASQASVTINLTLDDALKSKVTDDQIIFVFARPVGGRMPLAAERLQVRDLPAKIILDDSKAAMPTATISSVEQVEVTARVSLSGQPMPNKGDLFVTLQNINVKQNPTLDMKINQIVE